MMVDGHPLQSHCYYFVSLLILLLKVKNIIQEKIMMQLPVLYQ